MISYAVSLGSFGGLMTPALADAFRKSKLHNLELSFTPYTEESAQAEVSRELTRSLLKEKTVRSSSVHLPFYGGGVPGTRLRRTKRRAGKLPHVSYV